MAEIPSIVSSRPIAPLVILKIATGYGIQSLSRVAIGIVSCAFLVKSILAIAATLPLLLGSPVQAQTSAWEWVAEGDQGDHYYLDTGSIARSQSTVQYSLFVWRSSGANALLTVAADCQDSRFQIRHLIAIGQDGQVLLEDPSDSTVQQSPIDSPSDRVIDRACSQP